MKPDIFYEMYSICCNLCRWRRQPLLWPEEVRRRRKYICKGTKLYLSPLTEIRLINVNVSSISFYFIYFHSFLLPLLVIWIQYVQKFVAIMKTEVCLSSMTRTSIRQISPSAWIIFEDMQIRLPLRLLCRIQYHRQNYRPDRITVMVARLERRL